MSQRKPLTDTKLAIIKDFIFPLQEKKKKSVAFANTKSATFVFQARRLFKHTVLPRLYISPIQMFFSKMNARKG